MFQQKKSTPLPSLITKRKKKQADRSRGKNKRYKPEREPLDLDVLDEISEKLDDLAKVCQSNSIMSNSIKENFKCLVAYLV